MTLKEVIKSIDFKAIWDYLISEYPDQNNDSIFRLYLNVFEKLNTVEPIQSNLKLHINYSNENEYWNVSGIAEDKENRFYAIEFSAWDQWLGMEIESATLENYKPYEIAAHCLWEMTFIGFDENKIQGEREELIRRVNEVTDTENYQ